MDLIEFKRWNRNILVFECHEMGFYERHEVMELNTDDWKIKLKKNTQQ
jgi:hypothetical protein